MVFVIGSVYVMDYIYRFAYVEPALQPRDKADLFVADKLFTVLLDLVYQYLLRSFTSMLSEMLENFLFLLCLCQVLISG